MDEIRAVPRSLMLILVAFHPSEDEVARLKHCLKCLPESIGYSVVVNDYRAGEPVDQLASNADYWVANLDNLGYGRAVNQLVNRLEILPHYLGIFNTDLTWKKGTIETLLQWMNSHSDVTLAVPQIFDDGGHIQKLCKRNPTILALLSRRFWPAWFKPSWLKRYDRRYVMADHNYQEVFESPYLSGCCMLVRSDAFLKVGGFDERYFLYLEDADLTRSLSRYGRCVHLPVAAVVHRWGRGSYINLRLMFVNLISAWLYFSKWGWSFW